MSYASDDATCICFGCAKYAQLNEITAIYNIYNRLGNCLMQCFAAIRVSNYS